MRDGDRSERRTLPRIGGAFHGDGHQPRAEDRIRSRRGNREGERENRQDRARALPREEGAAAAGTRARARPGGDDGTRRHGFRGRLTIVRKTIAATIVFAVGALGPMGKAAENRIDLAAVITKADAQTALGEAVKDPQARSDEGADGYYSRCNYYSENPGKSLVLRVRIASAGQLEPRKQLEEMSAGNDKFKSVAGLGDKAAFVKEGPAKGPSHALMLYVAKGTAFVTVGISGVDDEKIATEKAKTVARKILGKL